MLRNLFNEERRYLNHFFDSIDIDKVAEVIKMCLDCKGLLIFTGVGKSGIIAEKIAMTLVSTGTKSLYLSPMNLLHGDIGIISELDLVVMLSKSGETEELLNLIPYIKRKGAKLLCLVSNPQARLAKQSDLFIHLPVEKELCSYDLVPTTSAAVQLIFGDILAIALSQIKEFSIESYALNHPSGAIGKKIIVKVKDLMFKDTLVPFCSPEDKLVDALVELSSKKCGALLIVDEYKKLLGIFTDGDLRRSLQLKGSNVLEEKMKYLMTATPMTIFPDMLAWDALKHMQEDPNKYVTVLPVVHEGTAVGILRMHDIIQAGIS